MASSYASTRRSLVFSVVITLVLALVLAALGGLYWALTKAPKFDSEQAGAKDRHFLFSIYGFEGDLLRRPTGVAFDEQGNIYVADTGKRRIVVFDGSGGYISTFGGEPGKGVKQLWQPIAVAVAPDGRAFVIDKGLKKMVLYSAQHVATGEITFPESPTGVTVANDTLFVTTRSGVVIGGLDGRFQTGYVKWGKGAGEFDMPGNVAIAPDGTLIVADSLNYRVQAITTKGKVKWVYGKPIPPDQAVMYNGPDRKFGLPSNVAVDQNGYSYVVDGLSSQIVVLDQNGKFIEYLGDVGHADGTFYYPDGIAYHGGRLAIADKFNDRIEVFTAPMAPSATDRLTQNAAWGLLLLIPLLLIPFFLRRSSRYVMAPSFLTALEVDTENRDSVVGMLKRVNAPDDFAAANKESVNDLRILGKRYDADAVPELMERFSLEQEDAAALYVAMHAGKKSVLLVNDEPMLLAAETLELSSLTYREVREAAAGSTGTDASAGEAS